jgi:hypothetical protein
MKKLNHFSFILIFSICMGCFGNNDSSNSNNPPNSNPPNNVISVNGISLNETTIELKMGISKQLVATISPQEATNQNITWKTSRENRVFIDSNGLIYGLTAGTSTISATTEDGGFVAKCTVNVIPTWDFGAIWGKTTIEGLEISMFISVTGDSSGSTFAVGYVWSSLTYKFSDTVSVKGSYNGSGANAVLVKYNSTGEAEWGRSLFASDNASSFYSVKQDLDGNIYTAGELSLGSYTFDSGVTVNTNSASNIVLVKYDKFGNALWARTVNNITNYNTSYFNSIAIDKAGNIYAVGRIENHGTYDFGNSAIVDAKAEMAYESLVIVKYAPNGDTIWAKTVTNECPRSAYRSVAVDSSGNVFAAGYISGTDLVSLGNDVNIYGKYADGDSIIIVKYDSDGNAIWAKTVTEGSNYSWLESITIDSSDNIIIAGVIFGSENFSFGNDISIAGTSNDVNMLLMKYDSSGNAVWVRSVIEPNYGSRLNSVTTDSKGNIYAAGEIYGDCFNFFGNDIVVAGNYYAGSNALLLKYDSSGNIILAESTVEGELSSTFKAANSAFYSVTTDSAGGIITVGVIEEDRTYYFSNGISITAPCHLGYNLFILKYF